MAEKTDISWTDASFNPWWGCSKVSPACDHCYAERDSKRFAAGQVLWGVDAERRVFGDKHWNEPLRWNARTFLACSSCGWRGDAPRATKAGTLAYFSCPKCQADAYAARRRVFCASMADVFDKNAPEGARERLWELIEATPNLDWLLLTKRIGNAKSMLPERWFASYPGMPTNVRVGATVVNQEEADRDVPKLLALNMPNFLSIEPMLGPINLRSKESGLTQHALEDLIDWVIVGGESGPHARVGDIAWYESLRAQCVDSGVRFHMKQITEHGKPIPMERWPVELRLQEFPA